MDQKNFKKSGRKITTARFASKKLIKTIFQFRFFSRDDSASP